MVWLHGQVEVEPVQTLCRQEGESQFFASLTSFMDGFFQKGALYVQATL